MWRAPGELDTVLSLYTRSHAQRYARRNNSAYHNGNTTEKFESRDNTHTHTHTHCRPRRVFGARRKGFLLGVVFFLSVLPRPLVRTCTTSRWGARPPPHHSSRAQRISRPDLYAPIYTRTQSPRPTRYRVLGPVFVCSTHARVYTRTILYLYYIITHTLAACYLPVGIVGESVRFFPSDLGVSRRMYAYARAHAFHTRTLGRSFIYYIILYSARSAARTGKSSLARTYLPTRRRWWGRRADGGRNELSRTLRTSRPVPHGGVFRGGVHGVWTRQRRSPKSRSKYVTGAATGLLGVQDTDDYLGRGRAYSF